MVFAFGKYDLKPVPSILKIPLESVKEKSFCSERLTLTPGIPVVPSDFYNAGY